MTASRVPSIVDGLIVTFNTALATAGTDGFNQPGPVTVYDGPRTWSNDYPKEAVYVGYDGDDGTSAAADSDRAWKGLGQKKQDEAGKVQCAIVLWSGEVDFQPLRARAYVLLALIETAIVADPSLAGAVANPGWAQIGDAPLRQELPTSGAIVRIPLTVAFKTRI